MFLSLTNASPAHYGCPIAIDSTLVVTVHHSTVTREDGSRDDVELTKIFKVWSC